MNQIKMEKLVNEFEETVKVNPEVLARANGNFIKFMDADIFNYF